jgi:hypothetical protein
LAAEETEQPGKREGHLVAIRFFQPLLLLAAEVVGHILRQPIPQKTMAEMAVQAVAAVQVPAANQPAAPATRQALHHRKATTVEKAF